MNVRSDSLAETKSLLRNRALLRLLSAQFLTVTAVYALSLGGVAIAENRTQSSAQTGLVILSAILPAFIGSLIAGPVVDRIGRRRSLVASHLARSVACLVYWVGTRFLSPSPAMLSVYVANIAIALLTQFAMTSELSLLPDLVQPERLLPTNSIYQITMLAGEGLGIIALSPLIIKLAGAPSVGLAGAALCLMATLLVTGLRLLPNTESTKSESPSTDAAAQAEAQPWARLKADVQAGWKAIASDRFLTLVIIQAAVASTLLLVALSLMPGLAARHLEMKVEDATFLMLVGGVGFLLGIALMGRWQQRLSRQAWIAIGLTTLGLSFVLMAAVSVGPEWLWATIPILVVLGVTLALVIIPARTVLQERPPAELRGRVISAQLALGNAAAVLPLFLGGALADQIGIRPVLGLVGLLALAVGLLGLRHINE